MPHLLHHHARTRTARFSRRELLQIGAAGMLGIHLADVLRAEITAANARAQPPPRAKSCIILFLAGGPSHLDMWDMKPDAPAEVRGEFKPIDTAVPGVQLCEHLPRLAQVLDKTTLVRSMQHDVAVAHWAATYYALTGHDRGDATTASPPSPKDYPAIGSVVGKLRPPERPVVPYVSLPHITVDVPGSPPQPGVFGGWLGRACDPLFVLQDPNDPEFEIREFALPGDVSITRLDGRKGLLDRLDALDQHAATRGMDAFYQRAFSILTSPETHRAFDLSREPDAVRDAYGRNIYGQSVLLSRRLIEAGTRLVTLKWAPDVLSTWDTHKNNFTKLRDELLPQLDTAASSLLDDLDRRGLLDETLVAVMGEFGRTPHVGRANANAITDASGRDHWPYCYSLLVAGGGIARGRVVGRSDKLAAHPASPPIAPRDLVATLYHLLGIPPDLHLPDQLGQPLQLVRGARVLDELLA